MNETIRNAIEAANRKMANASEFNDCIASLGKPYSYKKRSKNFKFWAIREYEIYYDDTPIFTSTFSEAQTKQIVDALNDAYYVGACDVATRIINID